MVHWKSAIPTPQARQTQRDNEFARYRMDQRRELFARTRGRQAVEPRRIHSDPGQRAEEEQPRVQQVPEVRRRISSRMIQAPNVTVTISGVDSQGVRYVVVRDNPNWVVRLWRWITRRT